MPVGHCRAHFKFSRVGQSCADTSCLGITNGRDMFSSRTIVQHLCYCSSYIHSSAYFKSHYISLQESTLMTLVKNHEA